MCRNYDSLRTPERDKIRTWLKDQCSEHLAQVYEAIIVLAYGDPTPAKETLVAHSGREILNTIVRVLTGKGDTFPWAKEFRELVQIFDGELPTDLDSANVENYQATMPIRLDAAKSLQSTLGRFKDSETTYRDRVRELYERQHQLGGTPPPAADTYVEVQKHFVGCTHVGNEVPDWGKLVSFVGRLEDLLYPFATNYAEVLIKIDELVLEANS